MTKKLNVAAIGVGRLGKRHAENLRSRIPGARLVAVVDTNAELATRIAAELEIECHSTELGDALDRKDVDAIVISTPARSHADAIESAAKAGKHIFCEKPMVLTMAEADAALAAVQKAAVQLQLGFMRRYDPAYALAKERILGGEIGTPFLFKSVGRDPQPAPMNIYQGGINGTIFISTCVHDFDLARWMMNDEIVGVHSLGGVVACPEFAQFNDVDTGLVNLQFQRGGIGNIEALRKSSYGYDVRTEVLGTKGALQIGDLSQTPLRVLTATGLTHDLTDHWLKRFSDAYLLELRDFIHSILADRPVRVNGEDGRRALTISLAAQRSYRERRAVTLGEGASMAP